MKSLNLARDIKVICYSISVLMLLISFILCSIIDAEAKSFSGPSRYIEKTSKKLVFSTNTKVNSSEDDEDPFSYYPYDEYEDIDPLSFDKLNDEYSGEKAPSIKPSVDISKYAPYFEKSVPFVVHNRTYNLSWQGQKILEKVVDCEAGKCVFEQQAAIASIILNRFASEDFPDTIFEIVSAPNQFRESYAYAPFYEVSEKTKMAVSCALDGIDFSCGATYYYEPNYSSNTGLKFFQEKTTLLTSIVSREDLKLCCANDDAAEILSMQRYIYDSKTGTYVIYG